MSRSRKKTPIFPMGSPRRARDRKIANRRFRRLNRVRLAQDMELHDRVREVSDVWSWDCDGWKYIDPDAFVDGAYERLMRK